VTALNKSEVRKAFGKAASAYDAAAALQREVCDRTLEKLDLIKIEPTHLIDIGCGTGYGTHKLAQRFPQAKVTGIDIAQPMVDAMLARCNDKGVLTALKSMFSKPRVEGVCADAEQLPLPAASCDFAFSTFAIHWCDTLAAIKEAHRVLKPGGLILLAIPGPDTLRELRAAFKEADPDRTHGEHVNQFTDMHDIGDMLVEAGFADPVVDMELITVTYANVRDVLADLKAIGANNHLQARAQGLMGKSLYQRMTAAYERYRDASGKLPATYEVVYAHSWKPLQPKKMSDGRSVIRFEGYGRLKNGL
jgi:malonyl-CoA O-methyltransferase